MVEQQQQVATLLTQLLPQSPANPQVQVNKLAYTAELIIYAAGDHMS